MVHEFQGRLQGSGLGFGGMGLKSSGSRTGAFGYFVMQGCQIMG